MGWNSRSISHHYCYIIWGPWRLNSPAHRQFVQQPFQADCKDDIFKYIFLNKNVWISLKFVNSPHKGQWRWALTFSLICAWINCWVNNREAGHYDVTVMTRLRWVNTWWRHQMETFSALLAICAENSPVPGEFPAQRPVTRSFDIFFDLCLNKRLSKQPWG